ncbi:MAG: hypothetical protein KGN84_14900 [Acidobacteriota bacterium]|nr:hypothetical protein [Acidobacteriota bacterium]
MRRALCIFLATAASMMAANFKLYLKDGSYQLVREYKVEGDKLSYYSIDRGDWEEIPVSMVDLRRTDAETSARRATLEKQAAELTAEDAARAELRKEIQKIPRDPGVYRVLDSGELQILKLEENASLHGKKKRTAIKLLTGIPLDDKSTLEIPNAHADLAIHETRPEFYVQVSNPQDLTAIVKLTPKGDVRIVEQVTVVAMVKIPQEERESVDVFTKQLTESGLYKVWPQADLEKGEYAVLDFEEGKLNARIFAFRIE